MTDELIASELSRQVFKMSLISGAQIVFDFLSSPRIAPWVQATQKLESALPHTMRRSLLTFRKTDFILWECGDSDRTGEKWESLN